MLSNAKSRQKLMEVSEMNQEGRKLVIYKYPLTLNVDVNTIYAPIVKALKVDYQRDGFWLWALVDLNAPNRSIEVVPIGTGQPIFGNLSNKEHISTTITHNENLVLHWFIDKIDE